MNVLNSSLSRAITGDIRDQTEAAGRKRGDVKIYTILTAVIADSDAEAERKYREYASQEGAMALFGGFSGLDLAKFDKGSPLNTGSTNAIQTVLDLFTTLDSSRQWTPADIADHMSIGGVEPVLVGSPETVVDEIERWIDKGDLDGINLSYAVTPHDIEAFVDTVVTELQNRGRVWKDYERSPLREYLSGEGNRRLSSNHPGVCRSVAVRQTRGAVGGRYHAASRGQEIVPRPRLAAGVCWLCQRTVRIILRFRNSSIPRRPCSRPMPERLMPPNGSSAPTALTPLTNTIPASTRSATRAACSGSVVKT